MSTKTGTIGNFCKSHDMLFMLELWVVFSWTCNMENAIVGCILTHSSIIRQGLVTLAVSSTL